MGSSRLDAVKKHARPSLINSAWLYPNRSRRNCVPIFQPVNSSNEENPAYHFHVALNVGIGSDPRFRSNQNAGAPAAHQHPLTVDITLLCEQIKYGLNVIGVRCRHVVVGLADQFFPPISKKLTETVRNLHKSSVAVYNHDERFTSHEEEQLASNSSRIDLTASRAQSG